MKKTVAFEFSGKLGDEVLWASQAGGNMAVKRGTIIEVVPAGEKPKTKLKDPGFPRDHETYVVRAWYMDRYGRVRRANYWPRTKQLRLELPSALPR